MNKKLAKKKTYFFSLLNFSQTVGPHWVEKDRDVGLRTSGKGWGVRVGGNSWWKNMVHILHCAKSPSLGQLGPVWPGPIQLSPQGTWLLLGAADAQQMAGWCAVKFQLFFFLLVTFQQQHDCIISSTHTWQNRARFSLNSPESLSLFLFYLIFFFLYKRTKPDLSWRCFWRNQLGTENHDLEDRKLKSVQAAHNRYSPSFGNVASATSLPSF